MGSVGAVNTIMSKIDKVKFKKGNSINGEETYTADVPGVGKGVMYKDKKFWQIIIGKYTNRSNKLEMVDMISGLNIDHTNTEQEARDLVKEWLKAIAKGQA